MPIRLLDRELLLRKIRTPLFFGPPNSRKTSGLLTFPFEEDGSGDLVIFSFPGEEGYNTIPVGYPGVRAFIWEEPPGDAQSAMSMMDEVNATLTRLIAGQLGNVKILAGDGFHNMYQVYMNVTTNGAFGRGEDLGERGGLAYGRAHQMANTFLRRFYAAPVPYKVLTAWDAREADRVDPLTGRGDKSGHNWPMLPGQMAKWIVGKAGLTIFTKIEYPRTPMDKVTAYWQLKPDNEVWGAAVKTDPRFIEQIPDKVPQDWKLLEPLLTKCLETP
mgnify:CR=1 FL=1